MTYQACLPRARAAAQPSCGVLPHLVPLAVIEGAISCPLLTPKCARSFSTPLRSTSCASLPGDLDRRNHSRGLLRLVPNNCHIALLQEAQSTRLQDWCDYSGLVQSVSGGCAVLGRASGTKHVCPLYGTSYRGRVLNTFSDLLPEVAWFHAVEVRWFNDTEPLTRAGSDAWWVCSVHWRHDSVKGGKNLVGKAMLQFMYLMVRDKVRLIAGDFNQCFRYITAVMDALMAKDLFESYVYNTGCCYRWCGLRLESRMNTRTYFF